MTLLKLNNIEVCYGAIVAVRDVSLSVGKGEIVCLVGPNGAGKSSTTLAISGVVPPTKGSVEFDGKDIKGMTPEALSANGIALVPEGRHIFSRLSVRDNLVAACLPGSIPEDEPIIYDMFPILKERRRQQAGQLSGGEQQQLAIARAILRKPKLIMIDEPSLGLSPKFVSIVFGAIRTLREDGASLLVVEQSARRALGLADRVSVMRNGHVMLSGRADELKDDPEFERVYFGGDAMS